MVLDRFSSFLILVSTLWSVNKKLKRAFENLKKKKKEKTVQGDDYTILHLLDYPCFTIEHCKITAIELSKEQALDVDPRAMQQRNFTGNLEREARPKTFFYVRSCKWSYFTFFTRYCNGVVDLTLLI